MRAAFTVSAIFGACLALFALYETAYFGWLTATPLTEAQLKHAQYDCHAWFFIFLATFIGTVAMIVFRIRYRRRPEDRN